MVLCGWVFGCVSVLWPQRLTDAEFFRDVANGTEMCCVHARSPVLTIVINLFYFLHHGHDLYFAFEHSTNDDPFDLFHA